MLCYSDGDELTMRRYRRGDIFVNPNINAMFDDDVVIELFTVSNQ